MGVEATLVLSELLRNPDFLGAERVVDFLHPEDLLQYTYIQKLHWRYHWKSIYYDIVGDAFGDLAQWTWTFREDITYQIFTALMKRKDFTASSAELLTSKLNALVQSKNRVIETRFVFCFLSCSWVHPISKRALRYSVAFLYWNWYIRIWYRATELQS